MVVLPIVDSMLSDMRHRAQFVREQLSSCPEGRMLLASDGGRQIVMEICGAGKTRSRKRITSDAPRQIGLARRVMLSSELECLEESIETLEDSCRRLQRCDGFDRSRFVIENYPWLTDDMLQKVCAEDLLGGAWASEPYEKSTYMSERLTMCTSRGLLVRSKSELIIAEMLYRYGISFRYEQVLHVSDRYVLVPDFTIRRADGKIFIWEHEGLINSKSYVERQRRKSESYAQQGFVPWDNLIITYDTDGGNIDVRIVESEIRNRLLI